MVRSGLTLRFQRLADSLMPQIASTLVDKNEHTQIDLATAENHLIREEVVEIYRTSINESLTCDSLSYPTRLGGEQHLVKACAGLFNTYFKPHARVLPEHIVIGPGVTACITSLLSAICDPGDVVFVPGSYWNGFDFHFNMGPAVELVNVALGTLSEDELEQDLVCSLATALARDTMIGKSLRAVVLTNPHNPTGRCYSSKILMAVAGFCQKHDIHLIVDEIYALSRCRQCCSHENDFVSILALDLGSIKVAPARIHCVWGTSKDFGSSGIRMGCVISQNNPELCTSIGIMTTTQTSSLMSIATTNLLTSSGLPRLVRLNTARLGDAYQNVTGWLKAHNVPFIPPTHGVYILARLAPDASTWEDEAHMIRKLKSSGVLVAPGRSLHLREKGWVRMTIALKSHIMAEALRRIAISLGLKMKEPNSHHDTDKVQSNISDAALVVDLENNDRRRKARKRKSVRSDSREGRQAKRRTREGALTDLL